MNFFHSSKKKISSGMPDMKRVKLLIDDFLSVGCTRTPSVHSRIPNQRVVTRIHFNIQPASGRLSHKIGQINW